MFFMRVILVMLCAHGMYSNAMDSAVAEACSMRIIPEDTPIFRERLVIKNGMPYKIRIVYDELLTKDGEPTSPIIAVIPPDGEYILAEPHTVRYLHVEVSGKIKRLLNVRSYVNLIEKFGIAKENFQMEAAHILITISPGTVSVLSSIPFIGSSVDSYIAPFAFKMESLFHYELMKMMAIADDPCLRGAFPCVCYAMDVDRAVPFPKHFLGLSLQGKTVLEEQRSLAEEFVRLKRLWALRESLKSQSGGLSESVAPYFSCVKQILQSAYNVLREQKALLADERETITKIGLPISLIGRVTTNDEDSFNEAAQQLRDEWKQALDNYVPDCYMHPYGLASYRQSLCDTIYALLKKEAAFAKVGTMLSAPFNPFFDVSRVIEYILKKKCGEIA